MGRNSEDWKVCDGKNVSVDIHSACIDGLLVRSYNSLVICNGHQVHHITWLTFLVCTLKDCWWETSNTSDLSWQHHLSGHSQCVLMDCWWKTSNTCDLSWQHHLSGHSQCVLMDCWWETAKTRDLWWWHHISGHSQCIDGLVRNCKD